MPIEWLTLAFPTLTTTRIGASTNIYVWVDGALTAFLTTDVTLAELQPRILCKLIRVICFVYVSLKTGGLEVTFGPWVVYAWLTTFEHDIYLWRWVLWLSHACNIPHNCNGMVLSFRCKVSSNGCQCGPTYSKMAKPYHLLLFNGDATIYTTWINAPQWQSIHHLFRGWLRLILSIYCCHFVREW